MRFQILWKPCGFATTLNVAKIQAFRNNISEETSENATADEELFQINFGGSPETVQPNNLIDSDLIFGKHFVQVKYPNLNF